MRIPILPLLLLLVPAGAEATEQTPEAAVSALWRALSNEPGASADVATLERLFHADAVVFGGSYRDGNPVLQRKAATEFLTPYRKVSDKGFHECEIARVVQAYDRFATVYSVVESRAQPDAPKPDFVGVNSIQLYQAGTQWKILSLYYHVGNPALPIATPGAQSGACID